MRNFDFWQKWLVADGIILAVFGAVLALFNGTGLLAILDNNVNPVFWGGNTINGSANDFKVWIYGVLGASMVGWGILFLFIARYPFKNKEKWAWNGVAIGITSWYIIDTSISFYFAVYFNALLNTFLLALVALPLVFTRRYFIDAN